MYLISTEEKSPEQIAEECWRAQEVYRLAEEKALKEMSQEENVQNETQEYVFMKKPIQCHLWNNPCSDSLHLINFDVIETYEDDGHLSRRLVKCKDCGQLYFKEFYEWIDWENGNDPQYGTLIPVETDEDIEMLRKTDVFGLLQLRPCLRSDFPSTADTPKVYWLEKN